MPDHNHDEDFLRQALELAHRGVGLSSPNPNVGAVIVAGLIWGASGIVLNIPGNFSYQIVVLLITGGGDKAFVAGAAALCTLIAVSFGVPAVAWYRRTEEKQRAFYRELESQLKPSRTRAEERQTSQENDAWLCARADDGGDAANPGPEALADEP